MLVLGLECPFTADWLALWLAWLLEAGVVSFLGGAVRVLLLEAAAGGAEEEEEEEEEEEGRGGLSTISVVEPS